MLKTRFVTRTIKTVSVTCVGVNINANPPTLETKTFMVTGDYSDPEILEHIREKNPGFVPAQVTERKEEEKLYKLSESLFVQYGEEVTKQ